MAKILEKFFRNPYRYMYIFMCVASLLLIAFNNYWIFLITMISLLLICITISKLDFCHPYCNILPILVLYQIAFPILNHYGIKVFETVNIHSMYYLYSWIATNCFILFLGKITNPINYSKKDLELKTNNKILLFFYCLLSFLAIVASIYIIYKGYSSKYELSQNLNILLQVGMIAYVALIPITFYNYFNKENKNKKLKIIIIILTLILMFFGMMTTGERSYAFNYILMSFLAVTSLFKIDLKKKIAVILILVLFVANSSNLKMFFSRNNIYTELKKEENIVLQFLNSDFASQGFNFNYVLLKKDEYNKFYGLTYVYDFLSPIDDIVPIVKKLNVNSWYQNTFWANRRTGLGFTIIGEGYVNFGILGIILSMFILAKITKYLYFNSNKNAYTFVIYLAFINYSMYACRGSLANIISPLFKYYILLAIILYHLPYFKIKDKIVYYKDKKINFLK